MLAFGQQSVGTSPVKLVDNATTLSTVVISNGSSTAANIVYIGTSASVTSANGCPLPANGVLTLRQVTGGPIWVVGAVAGPTAVGFAVGNAVG